ncbi:hypothetical protein [Sphingobium sp.]|uniref:hypothetical protein n=1 Tax=Sphingobium sp. TaxID=1912891 RepID=UPI002C733FE6|nr:hypothetical protein [Sphingobium sp.]HUD92867.1 hypothetical protein [Sphingobium sp.]
MPADNLVSASAVITKRHRRNRSMLPTVTLKGDASPFRMKALNCSSFPRFRSQPIQQPWAALNRRGRCSKWNGPRPLALAKRALSSSIPLVSARTISASTETLSCDASAKSLSSTNSSAASGLERRCASRRRSSGAMSDNRATKTGITTAVAELSGMPSLKSSLGSTFGRTMWVTSQLTKVMLRIDAGSRVSGIPRSQDPAVAPVETR